MYESFSEFLTKKYGGNSPGENIPSYGKYIDTRKLYLLCRLLKISLLPGTVSQAYHEDYIKLVDAFAEMCIRENLKIVSIGCGAGVVEQYYRDRKIKVITLDVEGECYDSQITSMTTTPISTLSRPDSILLAQKEGLPTAENVKRIIEQRIRPLCNNDLKNCVFMLNFPPLNCLWEGAEKKVDQLVSPNLGLAHYVDQAIQHGAKIFYFGKDFGHPLKISPLTPITIRSKYLPNISYKITFRLPISNRALLLHNKDNARLVDEMEYDCAFLGFASKKEEDGSFFMGLCDNPSCTTTIKKNPAENLKTCSACKRAHYCSKDCQKADWKQHKQKCVKVVAGKTEA